MSPSFLPPARRLSRRTALALAFILEVALFSTLAGHRAFAQLITTTTGTTITGNVLPIGIGTTSPADTLDLGSRTDAMTLPVGSTGQRPSSPVAGMMRYNLTTPAVEAYYSNTWNALGSAASNYWTLSGSNLYPNSTSYNVGIGTTGPNAPLVVNGSGGSNGTVVQIAGGTDNQFNITPTVNTWGLVLGADASSQSASNYHGPQYSYVINIQNAPLILGAHNTAYMTILGGGNVGIGTTAPINTLEIPDQHGTVPPSSGTTQAGSITTDTGNVGLTIGINNSSPFGGWIQAANKAALGTYYDLLLNPNGGNVGIGTTAPTALLSLGNAVTTVKVAAYDNGTDVYGMGVNSGELTFGADITPTGTPQMVLTSAGSVGIGTTGPDSPLHVVGAAGAATDYGPFTVEGSANNGLSIGYDSTNNWSWIYSRTVGVASRPLVFENGVLYVGLDGGNVGIGTTAPSYLLQVGSSSASGIVAEFQNSAGACTFTPSASSMTPSCSSDLRLKKDIADTGDALAWLGDMRVRDFTIRSTGARQTGVVAQEMLEAHPDMVHMGDDGFYKVDGPNPWKLVKAIQELKADNDNLRAATESLKAAYDDEAAQIKVLSQRLATLEAVQH